MVFDTTPSNEPPHLDRLPIKATEMRHVRIFVDFDGTITTTDVGDGLFEAYGSIQPFNKMLKANEITIYDYWKQVCNTLPGNFNQGDIERYMLGVDIDPYFKTFIESMNASGINPIIVSDGFDNYIKPFLECHDLGHLQFYSNSLHFSDKGHVVPIFRYANDGCQCFSAVCKRAVQCLFSASDSITIYIGDGYSDFCPAESSDIVFAKKSLAKWCNSHSQPHYPYKSFYEVNKVLTELLSQGKAKQRNRAKTIRANMYKYE